jgi:NAD(P)-dependent dehydrogenase (short-subunit alcohol dehydrogenase family)
VFFLTQKLLPLINDGGRIVAISSGTTRIIFPGSAAYASMKGAVEVLTRYLAKELGPRRIASIPSLQVPSRPISAAAWFVTIQI